MLPRVVDVLNKSFYAESFLAHKGCAILALWLRKLPDGTLPNIELRTKLLDVMTRMPISTALLKEDLDATNYSDMMPEGKTPRLGEAVRIIMQNPDETVENKKLANRLVEKWLKEVLE